MNSSSKWIKGKEMPLYTDWDYLGHLDSLGCLFSMSQDNALISGSHDFGESTFSLSSLSFVSPMNCVTETQISNIMEQKDKRNDLTKLFYAFIVIL